MEYETAMLWVLRAMIAAFWIGAVWSWVTCRAYESWSSRLMEAGIAGISLLFWVVLIALMGTMTAQVFFGWGA